MFLKEPSHILILIIVLVLLFGAKKLPDSAKSIAKSLKVFRDEMKSPEGKKSDGENGSNPKSKK